MRKASRKKACPKIVVESVRHFFVSSVFPAQLELPLVVQNCNDQQGRTNFTKSLSDCWAQGSNLVLPWVLVPLAWCLLPGPLGGMTALRLNRDQHVLATTSGCRDWWDKLMRPLRKIGEQRKPSSMSRRGERGRTPSNRAKYISVEDRLVLR